MNHTPLALISVLLVGFCGCDRIGTTVSKIVTSSSTKKSDSGGPAPAIALSEPVLVDADESKEKRQIRNQALQLLNSGAFDKLEQVAGELRASKAELPDGARKFSSFYDGLASVSDAAGDSTWQGRLRSLRAWASARPESVTARIALAEALKNYAWNARGTKWAREVKASQWKLFVERLAESRTILAEARKLNTRCPRWYSVALAVGLGEGWPRNIYDEVYTEAIQSDPDYVGPYLRRAHYLMPRWFGKPGELETFAETTADKRGAEEGDIFYARLVWYMDGALGGNVFLDTKLSWERAKKGFEVLEKRYPTSLSVISEFCKLSGLAGDRDNMQVLMLKLDGKVDDSVWQSKARFIEDRQWAFRGVATTNKLAAAHIIHLKDGRAIEGRIQTQIGSTLYIKTDDGKQVELSANDVKE